MLLFAASLILLLFQQIDAFYQSPFLLLRLERSFSSLPTRSRNLIRFHMTTSPKVENKQEPREIFKAQSATEEVQNEAREALKSVGWAMPAEGDLTSDDPFVQAIDQSIQNDIGVSLNDLLNPAKVVNLERDLYVFRTELARLTGATLLLPVDPASTVLDITTAECDLGGGGELADELRDKIAKKEKDLALERRSVFRGWLKNIFLGQAILSFGLSYIMATNPRSLFGGFDWYYSYNMDLSISVLGYWWWWLFVVPSLRSRRPTGFEKQALDLAFLGTPAVSVLAPVFTKDTGVIWAANLAVVVAAYAYAFLWAGQESNDSASVSSEQQQQPAWLKFVFKSLDFGSGKERGMRK